MLALGISGIVGLVLAFQGFAYWAIVIQTLVMVTIITLCYWLFSDWRPTFSFSLRPVAEMFRFGSKVMVTNAAESFSTYLFSIVFGRCYTEKEVGYFNQANKWNTMGYSVIRGMISGVAQPVLVSVNEEKERQFRVFRKMVRFTALFSFPALFGLALIAPEFITIAITDKWADSAQLMRILCIGGAFVPLSSLFSNLVLSRGHSSAYMWSNLGLLAALILVTVVAFPFGITGMVIAYSFVYFLWVFVWFVLVRKENGYKLGQLAADVLPFLGIACLAIGATYFLTRGIGNVYWLLVARIGIAAAIYIGLMWVTDSVTFKECVRFILKRNQN